MPSKPTIFHGREDLVEEVSHLLCGEMASQRVCILGPGGMGKTSLALAVVESPAVQSKYGSRCYWVPCVNVSSSFLLLQVLYTQLRTINTPATADILSAILSELNQSKEPTLLLLDNFETPWFPSPDEDTTHAVANILSQLHKCSHVAILLTMRLGKTETPCFDRIKWHTIHLQPVSEEASRLIFHDRYPNSKQDPDVDALLGAVGHIPYAVILMAKSGKRCGCKAKLLLEEWKRAGTGMISHSASPEEGMNRSISLSVDRDFVKQSPDALLLLQTLALLPAGTSIDNLCRWAPNIKSLSSAIGTLSDAALLLQSEEHPTTSTMFSILPVVQSYMHTTGRIPEGVRKNVYKSCYKFVLDHITQREDNPQDGLTLTVTEDRNIHFILLNADAKIIPISLHQHTQYLLYFALAVGWYGRNDISELKLSESLGDKMVARALFTLGLVHGREREYDTAEPYFSRSYHLFGRLTDPDSRKSTLECGLLLARTRAMLNRPLQPIIEFLQSLQETFCDLDDYQRALIKKHLAECLRQYHQISEALATLQQAKDLFKKSGHLVEFVDTLYDISSVYYTSSQFEKSLGTILEAREAAKCTGVLLITQACVNLLHGWCLVSLQRHTEALPIFQECLSILDTTGDLTIAAERLKHIGLIHTRQGSHRDACAAFENAIAKLTEHDGTTVSRRHEIMKLERLKKEVVEAMM